MAMAQTAAEEGIRISTIGFGSPEGEPIPEYDDRGEVVGYKKDQSGNVVLSRLDEPTLQKIAEVSNGQYYRATASGSELEALVDQLNTLQTAELSSVLDVRGIERFQFFLLIGLAALVVAELIPDRVVRSVRRMVAERRMAMRGQPVVAGRQ
jgi:Ca-activated chloride channel family protein